MSSSMRRRNGLMGLSLIGVSCLEVGVLRPLDPQDGAPARHLISAGARPIHEHHLARSALPRERVRSLAPSRPRPYCSVPSAIGGFADTARLKVPRLSVPIVAVASHF